MSCPTELLSKSGLSAAAAEWRPLQADTNTVHASAPASAAAPEPAVGPPTLTDPAVSEAAEAPEAPEEGADDTGMCTARPPRQPVRHPTRIDGVVRAAMPVQMTLLFWPPGILAST